MTKLYRILNSDFESVPKEPYYSEDGAKIYIDSLLETYNGPFYIQEINIVYSKSKEK